MNKLVYGLVLLAALTTGVLAKYDLFPRMGVGDVSAPEAGTIFAVQSTSGTSIPCPKMTEAERDALSPIPSGSCVYNTTAASNQFYNGSNWLNAGSGAVLSEWASGVDYGVGNFVYTTPDYKLYVANTAHTSSGTFSTDIANWDEVSPGIQSIVSSTDNGVVRWGGTSGDTIQDSSVVIDDSDNVSGITNLTVTGTTTLDTALTGVGVFNSGVVGIDADVDQTELGYLDGVTSLIQGQLDGKVDEVSSTDNAITRFDGTSGSVQDSAIIIDDSSNITGLNDLDLTGTADVGTNLNVTGTTTLNSGLSGVAKLASGVVSAGLVDLDTEVDNVLPIANGGTGSATQNFVDLTTNQTVAGVKTFSNQVIGSSGLDLEGITTINNVGSGNLVTITQDSNGNALTIDQNGSGNALDVQGAMTIDNNITMNGTGALKLPEGTTAQRPTGADGKIRFNSDLDRYEGYKESIADWGELGGGGAGGINYIDNSNIEANDDGYSVFDDAAFPPVDGTGGTTSVTVARSTTSGTYTPIRETASLLFTKTSGADYTGEGFSYDFTIDKGQQANKLTGYVWVLANDADCVDDALKITVYDVTNTQMLRVNGEGIKCSDLPQKHYFQFQAASDSTSYRLVFTYDSTDTNEVLYYFDEFNVAPTRIAYGSVKLDWKDYTPTLSNITATSSFKYARDGDTIHINGTISATGAATGTILFTLPSGLSLDSSKLPLGAIGTDAFQKVGHAIARDSSPATLYHGVVLRNNTSTNEFYVVSAGDSGTNLTWNASNPYTTASGDQIIVNLSVPIQGWSSQAAMSEDLGSREIVSNYSRYSQSISASTTTTIIANTKKEDTTGSYNTTTGEFTAPESGYYDASLVAKSVDDITNPEVAIIVQLNKNNGTIEAIKRYDTGNSATANISADFSLAVTAVKLNKGDTLEFQVFTDDASGVTITNSRVSFAKRASPQTILDNNRLECQTKQTSSDVTTNTTVSALTMNNLEIGKKYSVNMEARFQVGVGDATASVQAVHDGVTLASAQGGNGSVSNISFGASAVNECFEATASTVTVTTSSLASGSFLRSGVRFRLCQLPSTTICNSSRFD